MITGPNADPAGSLVDEVDGVIDRWSVERPELDTESIGVFGRLHRLGDIRRAVFNDLHDRWGLTAAAYDVLAQLRRSGEPYRMTAGELASSSLITSGGITFRLDRMEAAGFVHRQRCDQDRRVVYVELTEHGREVIDSAIDTHLETEREMLAELTDDERRQLSGLLRKLMYSFTRYQPSVPETASERSTAPTAGA